uniref:Flocculin, putative n=1 Tax=Apis cerana TaxID=7461 RepID=V9IGV5_APICE
MPRKENTKAKTWERDRRKRMNAYFKTLADLLPPHQEGRKRNKVDILIHASKYIKDLHSRTEELFSAHASEAHKEELARLKKTCNPTFLSYTIIVYSFTRSWYICSSRAGS